MRRSAVLVAVAALAGALSAATTGSAAGTRVESTVVRTWNCQTNAVAVNYGVQVSTWSTGASVSTGDPSAPEDFVSFTTHKENYTVGNRCRPVAKHVVMSRNDLVASHAPHVDCASPGHLWVKLVLELDSSHFPQGAKIEITQPHAKLKPLAQLVWSRNGSTTYHRPECTTSGS